MEPIEEIRKDDARREWLEEAMADWPCSCPAPTKPYRIVETEARWFVGLYQCAGCGRMWRTGWSLSQLRHQSLL